MTIHGFPPAFPPGLSGSAQAWQRRRDLDTLETATRSSNLEAARNATASLTLDTPTAPAGAPGGDSFRSDLRALIDAVRKGDLSAAQQALTSLEHDLSIGYDSNGATLRLTSFSITIQFGSRSWNGADAAGPDVSNGATSTTTTVPTTGTTNTTPAPGSDPSTSPADPAAGTPPARPASPAPVNPIKALIDAIRSGDIDAARKALAQLESAMQGVHGHPHGRHHHHHHHTDTPAVSSTTIPTTTDDPAATS